MAIWSNIFGLQRKSILQIWMINHQTSNIWHTLVGNKIVDYTDVVGASPVSAALDWTQSFNGLGKGNC